jgi:hypothetical protein
MVPAVRSCSGAGDTSQSVSAERCWSYYDAVAVNGVTESVPELISQILLGKGAEASSFRELRNNLIFVVADSEKIAGMRRSMMRRIGLRELGKPDRLQDLADRQKERIRDLTERRSMRSPRRFSSARIRDVIDGIE